MAHPDIIGPDQQFGRLRSRGLNETSDRKGDKNNYQSGTLHGFYSFCGSALRAPVIA
jgi:hypothetical protein